MNALYDASIPVFASGLTNMRACLAKAESHAESAGSSIGELIQARLAPDMYTYIQQVGYAYFTALEAAGHLCAKPQPEMSYDETTASELHSSMARVVAYLESIGPNEVETSGAKKVQTFLRTGEEMRLDRYLHYFALPNFYFHVTTGYGILRHRGVPLGKSDYIGAPPA